jgi:hypothetical protein
MPDCCFFHMGGGNELMACDDGKLVPTPAEVVFIPSIPVLREWVTRDKVAQHAAVLVPSVELAKLKAERDEAVDACTRRTAAWVSMGIERDRLRAALEPTPENVEALAQFMFAEQWSYPSEDGPNDPPPPWQKVIDDAAAEGWRCGARAVLGFLRASAGVATDLKAAEVNHDRRDDDGASQPTGAAVAPTGQDGGEQLSPVVPPAGLTLKPGAPILDTANATITRASALLAMGPGGKELLRVPAGVTPAELRAFGFNDVADRMEGKPGPEAPHA